MRANAVGESTASGSPRCLVWIGDNVLEEWRKGRTGEKRGEAAHVVPRFAVVRLADTGSDRASREFLVARVRPLRVFAEESRSSFATRVDQLVVSCFVANTLSSWRGNNQSPQSSSSGPQTSADSTRFVVEIELFTDRPVECAHVRLETVTPQDTAGLDVHFGALVQKDSTVCLDAFGLRSGCVQSMELFEEELNAGEGLKTGFVSSRSRIELLPISIDSKAQLVPVEEWCDSACRALGEYARPAVSSLVRWVSHAAADRHSTRLAGHEGFGRGAILHGPSGVGKSHLVRTVLEAGGIKSVTLSPEHLFRAQAGLGEAALKRALFPNKRDFSKMGPGPFVVVLDQLEIIAEQPGPDSPGSEFTAPLIACLDRAFARLHDKGTDSALLVLGVTSTLELVERRLLHPKRLGLSIKLGVPVGLRDRKDLAQLLMVKHGFPINLKLAMEGNECGAPPLGQGRAIDGAKAVSDLIGERANGFVPAEMDAVVRDLALLAGERMDGSVSQGQVLDAFSNVSASALKSSQLTRVAPSNNASNTPNLESLSATLPAVTQALITSVELPLRSPERLRALGVLRPPRGVLLHGPSGNGKTLSARALAASLDQQGLANFVFVQCTELVSKVVGESEAAISAVFRRARAASPCVVFLDQIEAVAPVRGKDQSSEQSMDRMLSCLLTEMDGIRAKGLDDEPINDPPSVIVLGATVDKKRLDPALLRPGRFDRHVLVSPPSTCNERKQVLVHALCDTPIFDPRSGMVLESTTANVEVRQDVLERVAASIVDKSKVVCSRAQLAAVAREAAMIALRENIDAAGVAEHHLLTAARLVI